MRTALVAHRVQGDGERTVLLVHGVGVDAGPFAPVAERLARHLTVVTVDRRGYGGSRLRAPAGDLADQVDDLRRLVDVFAESSSGRPSVVGVSGGATLALGLAIAEATSEEGPVPIRSTADIGTIVVHEPLLGDLAPALDQRVHAAYESTLAHGEDQAETYVADLVGADTWSHLDDGTRGRVVRAAPVVADEVPTFLDWAPTVDDLHRLRSIPLVTSVGERSPAPRWEASEVLRREAGARAVVVPGAGHLPQVDAPEVFADALLDALSWTEGRGVTTAPARAVAATAGRHVAGTTPYPWPYDGDLDPARIALVVAGHDSGWIGRCGAGGADATDALTALTRLTRTVTGAGGLVVGVHHRTLPTPPRTLPTAAAPVDDADLPLDRTLTASLIAAGIDGFYGSGLDAWLRQHGRDHLLIAGFGLEAPVHSTLRSANDRGYECLLVIDASAPLATETAAAARSMVEMSGGIFGAVGATDAVVAALSSPTPTVPVASS